MTDPSDPRDYGSALAEAQRLGYAEADPRGDVEGRDAVNKLVILARLAFDRWLDPASIPTRPDGADGPAGAGITTVSLADQVDARRIDRIIRLVATASIDQAGAVRAAVLPTALPVDYGARPDGRGAEPDRDRCHSGRAGRVRRSWGRWRSDLVRRARGPDRDRSTRRLDLGGSPDGRPGRSRRIARAGDIRGGQRDPVSDR